MNNDDISELLSNLQELAPKPAEEGAKSVLFKPVGPDDIINEAGSEEIEYVDDDEDQHQPGAAADGEEALADEFYFEQHLGPVLPPYFPFVPGAPVPLAAIDCGLVQLGITPDGLVIALRATIVRELPTKTSLYLFRTGPIYLRNDQKVQVMQKIGAQLGSPGFYVRKKQGSPPDSQEMELKGGVDFDAHSYADRLRNWLERKVQYVAADLVHNGILLLDGALTLRTRDTPSPYLRKIAKRAHAAGSSVIAVSKQSDLQVSGKSVRFWLDDVPHVPAFRRLTQLMLKENAQRVLGNTYAVRFTGLGPTLRMDLKAAPGEADNEVLESLFGSTLMRGGYPDILVRAHVHSYFTSPQVVQLKAQASTAYGLVPLQEISFGAAFGPFAGRYKK